VLCPLFYLQDLAWFFYLLFAGNSQLNSKLQASNFKQISNLNFSMTKTLFGILTFGHCDLFDICVLGFGI
jgi:hypothetical protein